MAYKPKLLDPTEGGTGASNRPEDCGKRGGKDMKSDKANTLDCPFVSRKCKGDRCMAWEKFKVNNSVTTSGMTTASEIVTQTDQWVGGEGCKLLNSK